MPFNGGPIIMPVSRGGNENLAQVLRWYSKRHFSLMSYISLECLFLGRDVKWSVVFDYSISSCLQVLLLGSQIIEKCLKIFSMPCLFGPLKKSYLSVWCFLNFTAFILFVSLIVKVSKIRSHLCEHSFSFVFLRISLPSSIIALQVGTLVVIKMQNL